MLPLEMDAGADARLIQDLIHLSEKAPKLVKSTNYTAPAMPIAIRSWKMNEFKYYDVPSPFPTLARGLFTRWVNDDEEQPGKGPGKHQIIVRGYDKFFNIGEVPWTTWDALETHTSPPYDLTLKSNGCIIFMAALTPSKLLVTSKHSLGARSDVEESHAQVGERWLLKHLQDAGKTPEQFAQVLWDRRWTAVAELCDDNFEEHVLPYSPEKTGLHLHGLNACSGAFHTQPPSTVSAFAREWGFIETASYTVHTIAQVKNFTDEVSKAGQWNGEPVEGFVVRCHVTETNSKTRAEKTAPPYPPRSSFFFKVKFDEPYMTYRDWREITKILLSASDKGKIENVKIPKSKLRRPESHLYQQWVSDEIKRDKKQFANYQSGKGIIATRERFLKWMASEKDTDALNKVPKGDVKEKKFGKTIVFPVAIPGCGKTAIAVALVDLFGFGHAQSDDVVVKKAAPQFLKNVRAELQNHDVVIADKNNHLQKHRADLRELANKMDPPARLVALNWALHQPPAMVHRICADRVMQRGDNHQSLRPDVDRAHEEVLWMFLNQSEELVDDEVDAVAEMEVGEDLEAALDRAVDACVRILDIERPTQESVGQALAAARAYAPKERRPDAPKKSKSPRYYGFLPECSLSDILSTRLAQDDAPAHARKFWESLRKDNRVTKQPHITIVHSKQLPQDQGLWDLCGAMHTHSAPPTFTLTLGHLVWDDRVMALAVNDISTAASGDADPSEEGKNFLAELDEGLRRTLHITVGTASNDIPPVEANALVSGWRLGQTAPNFGSLLLKDVVVNGRIKGLFG